MIHRTNKKKEVVTWLADRIDNVVPVVVCRRTCHLNEDLGHGEGEGGGVGGLEVSRYGLCHQ